ncbi:MAG: GNAT family N-acetyltransferase [Candidatus Aminicenantes bacterium]|jgi:hypothetical protein
MTKPQIRKYRPGDESKINDMYNSVFGTDRSLETWHWKYNLSPRGDIKLIYVMEDDGQIVGQYANLPLDVIYKGQMILGAEPVDISIEEGFRGKKLVVPLFATQPPLARAEGIRFGFGFPNEAHYPVGREVLGYKDVGDVLLMRAYLNPLLILAKLVRNPKILDLLRPLSKWLSRFLYRRRWKESQEDGTLEQVTSFDERFDRFWERMIGRYPIMVARHRRYLNWRYVQRPDVEYSTFTAIRDGELQGFVVLSVQHRFVRQGLVADLLAVDEKTMEILMKQAMRYFLAKGVDMVSSWNWAQTEFLRVVENLGFRRRRVAAPLVCMIFDDQLIDESFITDPQNWYVTLGDSDGV